MRRAGFVLALMLVATAADALPAMETVRGIVRRNTELACPYTCDNYYLEPDTGFAFIFLNGMDVPAYLGERVDIFGTRGLCGVCRVFNVVEIFAVPVGVEDTPPALPSEGIRLAQNYPNPFNPSTTIRYTVPQAGTARIVVYDLLGRLVQEIATPVTAGAHEQIFSAAKLASGAYFYRVEFTSSQGGHTQLSTTKSMLLVR